MYLKKYKDTKGMVFKENIIKEEENIFYLCTL